ncbi:sugar phosphate isomerase/epimerase and 4-hydroxyphenylpyruvate domain-containing protein [Verticiella sediminum]|uniref:3-dehydroshikimate dehydratase n=1 Tax=Verticiella sediminum TaxID=1247510 RepID=A0A556AUJ2_9BURK|nr:sugar phosphate isomerase/epimerase and 4-hydroxyphenylpyruvate domain-containing protein [Verticiella sediminum]TSH96618.1 sugar phosphate isomerase/epimerase and 4-hydroxyphenylpyruvate domain-containing protein [Verticiella sediminum]
MHKSIATVSMSGTLPEKLEAIAAAGFDGIELFENDFIGFRGTAGELRARAADLGLSIDLYQPFRDFEGMPEPQFRKSLERAERKFDLMQALGVPLMLCCSNTSPLAMDDQALAAAHLHELAERASRRGLRVGFEALAWGRHTRYYGQAWSIVQQAEHPDLGLILDSFHTLSLHDDPAGIADIPGDRIFFLQMADAPLLSMDVMQWARHHRNFPGQGELDVERFLLQTLRSGYAGPLSLEIFNDVFREASNRRIAVDAMRSLRYLENRVLNRLQTVQARPEPAGVVQGPQAQVQVPLLSLPPAPSLKAIAFVEFAVDEPHAELLGAVLQKTGFTREGDHRSKAATLYRKGHAALVLNTEPGSFARARFGSFGASVCAIGLCVDDPDGALERATALCSMPFDSPVGPGEIVTPAIVSPGGIVIHFIPSALGQTGLFGADFALERPWSAADAAGTVIDHVALCLNLDQRDTWVLFARAVLGLASEAREQYADPYGLTSSLGVSSGERSVRLVLAVSQSQRTRATLAANAQGGVAVSHISLSTDDIFAEVRAWRDKGVAFVAIPGNYYDDLATRFDLDPDLLARLRNHGVLFDRDAAGDYFHIYTEDVSERFCFELTQRSDGYAGYGASNSAIKLAAQAQAGAGRGTELARRSRFV